MNISAEESNKLSQNQKTCQITLRHVTSSKESTPTDTTVKIHPHVTEVHICICNRNKLSTTKEQEQKELTTLTKDMIFHKA